MIAWAKRHWLGRGVSWAIHQSGAIATKCGRATVIALACIIVVWLVGGFGLAGSDVQVFHTPLWIIGGCVAPWIAAIVAAVVLSRRVFVDFDLDDDPTDASTSDEACEEAARHE